MLKCWLFVLLCGPLALLAAPLVPPAPTVPAVVTLAIDDAHAPYCQGANGLAAGLYVQLLQRAAQHMPAWDLRLQPMPWQRALLEAEQGQVDGFMPPYRHAQRAWVALYIGPLHREVVVLSCSPQSHLGTASRWPGDFLGRRIGTVRGYYLSAGLAEAVAQQQLARSDFRNGFDALSALAMGQIDCIADDRTSIETLHRLALADPIWAPRVLPKLESPLELSDQEAFVAISRRSLEQRPELAEFAKALDVQLDELRRNGEMTRLMQQLK